MAAMANLSSWQAGVAGAESVYMSTGGSSRSINFAGIAGTKVYCSAVSLSTLGKGPHYTNSSSRCRLAHL